MGFPYLGRRNLAAFFYSLFRSRLPFKPNIRTILENFPKSILWCGGYIYFGRKVLNDFVYYQRVMTFLENKKGKDFWSLK